MSARAGPEYDELDVPGPDAPRELAVADGQEGRPRFPAMDEARGLAHAEYRQRVEGGWEPRRFEAPRAELARFDPERAGLPRISADGADRYIEQHRGARPWLAMAEAAAPESRLILVAMDIGGGHAHIRHEGWVTEMANMRRVAYLEDPAQLDPEKRYLSIDGLKPNDRPHRCGNIVTRITDPDAFATAFARGAVLPLVREALSMAFDPDDKPDEVTVPIADLLGSEGHGYCTGWRLESVDGSMRAARTKQKAWNEARAEGGDPNVPEPRARPIPTFEGGDILFAFARNDADKRYEVASMFVQPPDATRRTSRPESSKGDA